jgi:hypothetical protein
MEYGQILGGQGRQPAGRPGGRFPVAAALCCRHHTNRRFGQPAENHPQQASVVLGFLQRLADGHVDVPSSLFTMCRNKSAGMRTANGRRRWSNLCATVGAFSVGGARMTKSNSRANFASTGDPVESAFVGTQGHSMLTMTKTMYIVFVEVSGVFNGSESAYLSTQKSNRTVLLEYKNDQQKTGSALSSRIPPSKGRDPC